MKQDPDYLRSERFSLSKLAIERGLYGDSLTGLRAMERPSEKESEAKLLIDLDDGTPEQLESNNA